jgi:hypothetical protein
VPYGALVQASPDAVRRMPPVPALLATPLALLAALVVGFFSFIALAFSNGQFGDGGWLVVLTPAVLAMSLLVGVVLLLLGRSWLALVVPAGALAAVLLAAEVLGWWDTGLVTPLGSLVPGGAAVLAALPGVRSWVAARRVARTRR